MNIRMFAIVFICTAAPAIAFPLGVRVGSGWAGKAGSAAETHRPRAAMLHPVRVVRPGTLDGQSVPGAADTAAKSSPRDSSVRELSPVYPTSRSANADLSASQGMAPAVEAPVGEVKGGESERAASMPSAAADAPSRPSALAPSSEATPLSLSERPLSHAERRRYGRVHLYRHGWRWPPPQSRYAGHERPYGRSRASANPISAFAGLFFR